MTPELPDSNLAAELEVAPLGTEVRARIRAVVRQEARRVRVGLAEVSLHAGFAVGALVWAAAAVFA